VGGGVIRQLLKRGATVIAPVRSDKGAADLRSEVAGMPG
jgi:uncharacterized protein YbjT (DUF2867 family)